MQPGEIEKIQERLKKIETSVIPPQLKRMYLETEEKEVNPLYVSLDVKYIISWICEIGILDDLCLTLVDHLPGYTCGALQRPEPPLLWQAKQYQ